MKNNVKEVLDSIQEIATVQLTDFIGKAEYSAEVTTSHDKDYPLLNYFITGTANIQERFMEVPLAMRFLDVAGGMEKMRETDKEVKSDMVELAGMFVEAMEKAYLIQPQTVSYEAIYIQYGAGLSGIELNLTLSIKRPCNIITALPLPPNAPNVNLFTFDNFEDIAILDYCSDPDGLALELDSVGKPDYGTIELTANDIIKWTKEGATDVAQGLVDYTIKNTAGLTNTGRLSLAFEEISISIDTPTQNQEIPSDEDITVAFTVTPATQNYISAIALVVDGVETEKRSPYSTDDFVIDAGTLTEAAHTLRIRAYDLDDVQVFETGVRSFEVGVSQQFLLDVYPNQFGASFALHRDREDFSGDLIEIKRDNGDAQRFALDGAELPIATMSTFVGNGDGKVTWWKDQANGLEVSQTSDGACPLLFENGVLIEENGKPALKFSGAQWLNGGNILNPANRPFISFLVGRNTGTNQTPYEKGLSGSIQDNRYSMRSHIQFITDSVGNNDVLNYEWFNRFALRNQLFNTNNKHKAYDNNVMEAERTTSGIVDTSTFDFQIGASNDGSGNAGGNNHLIGVVSELHIYFEDKESDISNINNFINQRYNIY